MFAPCRTHSLSRSWVKSHEQRQMRVNGKASVGWSLEVERTRQGPAAKEKETSSSCAQVSTPSDGTSTEHSCHLSHYCTTTPTFFTQCAMWGNRIPRGVRAMRRKHHRMWESRACPHVSYKVALASFSVNWIVMHILFKHSCFCHTLRCISCGKAVATNGMNSSMT